MNTNGTFFGWWIPQVSFCAPKNIGFVNFKIWKQRAFILDACTSFQNLETWASSVLLPVRSLVTADCPFVLIVQRNATALPTLPILPLPKSWSDKFTIWQPNPFISQEESSWVWIVLVLGQATLILAAPTLRRELSPGLLKISLRSLRIGWLVNDHSWSEVLITLVCITPDQHEQSLITPDGRLLISSHLD